MTPEFVRKALRAVKDPELNLNVVDIGLIYDIAVSETNDVHIKMSLTSPGCPSGPGPQSCAGTPSCMSMYRMDAAGVRKPSYAT